MHSDIFRYITYFSISFILSILLTPIVRGIALKHGFVSYPRADRWHKQPTAMLGGISIYLSTIIPAIFIFGISNKPIAGLFLGGTFLFIIGIIDDYTHLKPYFKLFMQIIAAAIAIYYGIVIGLPKYNILAIPLTFLWIIGITNSFNLLDNIDGLAAGIAAISSIMLFFSFLLISGNTPGIFALILAGAVLGFLIYNFNPAKIFMGDSGSMFLGYSLAIISIAETGRHISSLMITMLIPVLILSVPIFDTIFVMICRKFQGKKIFEGGKDHTSHRLVTLGISQKKTVLLLYSISIIFGSIGLLFTTSNIVVISIIAFFAILVMLFFGSFLFEVSSYKDKSQFNKKIAHSKKDTTILNNILLYKRRATEVILDLILICIAYYCSYFLRFEGSPLLASNMLLVKKSLIWIILVKMSVFFIFGLYRGIWKYISISDLLTIFKVVSISSISSVLFLTFVFRFKDFSRTVFFIDWLLLLFLITGTRILFRAMGEFLMAIRDNRDKKILIIGAGDTGEMVIREIKRNKSLNYHPIGFIDDDPSKIGNRIQGISVLGPRSEIKKIIRAKLINEIIIAIPSADNKTLEDIIKICREMDTPYRNIKGILDRENLLNT